MMHRLLKRQLKKTNLDENAPPSIEEWQQFLARVSQTYMDTDQDRDLIERSLTVSSHEMQELYERLQQSTAAHIAELTALNKQLQKEIQERTGRDSAAQALPRRRTKRQHHRLVIETREPLILHDPGADYPAFRAGRHALANIASWLGIPLLFGDKPVGMIALDKQESGFYTQEHARLAMSFATQAAIAIENARLFDKPNRPKKWPRRLCSSNANSWPESATSCVPPWGRSWAMLNSPGTASLVPFRRNGQARHHYFCAGCRSWHLPPGPGVHL